MKNAIRNNYRLFLILCLPLQLSLPAQIPEWVTNHGISSKYPQSQYLVGFGIAMMTDGNDPADLSHRALINAKRNIIENIRVSINASSSLSIEENGDNKVIRYGSHTTTSSNVEIGGIETEQYYDKQNGLYYVLAAVNKDALRLTYYENIKELYHKIVTTISAADQYSRSKRYTNAIKDYIFANSLILTLKDKKDILSAIEYGQDSLLARSELIVAELDSLSIQMRIVRLVNRKIVDANDLAWFIVFQLQQQSTQLDRYNIHVLPFQYQDTKMGSTFSRYFHSLIAQNVDDIFIGNRNNEGKTHTLVGNYWIVGDEIKFIAQLRKNENGEIIATSEATITLAVVNNTGFELKPTNYRDALRDNMVFGTDDIIGNGLVLEAWTNQDNIGNMYEEGDTLKVMVRINMPCYLRMVYHLADGTRILLYDNYYMDVSKVNHVYELPMEFICTPPFGFEVLQMFASTEKYPIIRTTSNSGYNVITEQLSVLVGKTRGMKLLQPGTMLSEKRIPITTLTKRN